MCVCVRERERERERESIYILLQEGEWGDMIEKRHQILLDDNVLLARYRVEYVSQLQSGMVRHQLEVGQGLTPSSFTLGHVLLTVKMTVLKKLYQLLRYV